jgi:hypothetical protein
MKAKFRDGLPEPKKRIFTIQFEATDANCIKPILNRVIDEFSSGVENGEMKGPLVKCIYHQKFVDNFDFRIENINGDECKVFKSAI